VPPNFRYFFLDYLSQLKAVKFYPLEENLPQKDGYSLSIPLPKECSFAE